MAEGPPAGATEPAAVPGVAVPAGLRGVLARAALGGLRATTRLSPWPAALAVRRVFAASGAEVAAALEARAPADVEVVRDEPYGDHPDMRADVYAPRRVGGTAERLPTIVWTHGGGWVGGSKEEIGGYLQALAHHGFTVVGLRYSRAPEARYPTPLRQVLAALGHLVGAADRLHVDPSRLVLAGDSAGAQITAQVAVAIADPAAAARLGLVATVRREQLRAVVLCCGAYELADLGADAAVGPFFRAIMWAYSGRRDFDRTGFLSELSLPAQVTSAFPPAFVTAGQADPLESHSRRLARALRRVGVEVDELFYPADHPTSLGHEYQFRLGVPEADGALERIVGFCRRHTA